MPKRGRALTLLAAGATALALAGGAWADGPRGGTVVDGSAGITRSEGRTTIRQTSRRAVIDWRRFDVGRGHRVEFDQPGRNAATLNRVITARPSVIEGAIRAPGTVLIQNGAGVVFTGSARIDTGGLVATSQQVDAARFRRDGGLVIGGGERPGARVVNRGTITVGEAGLAALVGRDVENAGTIVADRGTVALAGGLRSTIDLGGDGILRIATGGAGRVLNGGGIDVGEGRVLLTAGEAARTLDAAINTGGVVRARGGRIEIVGRGGGKVRVSGTLDADGGARGGSVTLTGESVAVEAGSRISARGAVDGGTIRLGGDRQGGGTLRRAGAVALAAGAEVAAGGARGRGGSVVVWSEGVTRIDGAISAAGGRRGGFVETSSRGALALGPAAAVTAGAGGFWLLDPRDVIIGSAGAAPTGPGTVAPPAGGGYYRISHIALQNALDAGSDVTVTTAQPASAGHGDIIVERALDWTGPGNLRLEADRDISVEAAVSTGAGSFTAAAGRDLAVGADVTGTGAAAIALSAAGDLWVGRPSAGGISVTTELGRLSLEAVQGQVAVRRQSTHGTGIQVDSAAGELAVTAGTGILVEGGTTDGQWVRIGTETSAGAVTLVAPMIDVLAGAGGVAELVAGAGGALTLSAQDLTLRDSPAHSARIAARGGSALTIDADRQTWAGAVEAGTGTADGGDVRLSGAISATVRPLFSLAPNAGFTLAAATGGGTTSSYGSPLALDVSTSGTGGVSLGGPVTAARITMVSQERVRLGTAARLTGTGAGDAVVLAAGRHFVNAAGADALAADNGRWLVYVDRFAGAEGTLPVAGRFDLYGRTHAANPPEALGFAGNRMVWGERPVLTLTADTLRKTYGQAAAPGFAMSGLRPGDSLATALVSAPSVTSSGAPARAAARSHATRVVATSSSQGYVLTLVPGTLAVDPAPLTVTASDARRTYGAADPSFTGSITGFVAGDDAGLLGGALAFAAAATASSPVGSYAITPSGLTVPGGNYAITYVPGSLAVDPAPLAVTALDASRRVGDPDPAFAARYDGFVLGEDPGALGGSLRFLTAAAPASPAGRYALTPAGLLSGNYAISYRPGTLTVQPALPAPPATIPAVAGGVHPFRRGVPPLTPGDASFRTTIAEAPPAIANPFDLTYSLGDIVELAPLTPGTPAAADTQGFVPAAGGLAPEPSDGACRGSVARGDDGCGRRRITESYWGAAAEAQE